MLFFTPPDCASAQASVYPPPIPVGCLDLAPAAQLGFAACVTTAKDDFGSYQVSETVFYCFASNQPMNVRIVATKPDGSQLLVFNGFFDGAGACLVLIRRTSLSACGLSTSSAGQTSSCCPRRTST